MNAPSPHLPDLALLSDEELLDQGLTCQVRGQFKDALGAFTELLRRKPKDETAFHQVGSVLIRLGRSDKATAFLRKGLELHKTSKKLHMALGLACLQTGLLSESETHFKKAHELTPEDVDPLVGLAWVYCHTHRESLAATFLRAGLVTAPDQALAHLILGSALLKLEQREEGIQSLHKSIASFQEMIKVSPDYAEGLFGMGTALLLVGQAQQAKESLERARALVEKKDSPPAYLMNYFPLQDLYDSLKAACERTGDKEKSQQIAAKRPKKGQKDGDGSSEL